MRPDPDQPPGRPGTAAPERDDDAPPSDTLLSLERCDVAWLDRALPARRFPFLAVALALPAACWLAAYLLAGDRSRLLASREWLTQPLYLAVHVVVVRAFVTAYATNFLAGAAYLDVAPERARASVRRVLGPIGFTAALLVAAPFAWADLRYLRSEAWAKTADSQLVDGRLGGPDVLLGAMWSLEWLLNAYVWVIVLGFLAITMRLLRRHPWRADLETVLHERHYRPFLLMSAHGATVVLVFTAATAAYVWLAGGETTDYVGLWVTGALLLVGFVPPWMRLKNDLARRMRAAVETLRTRVIESRRRQRTVDDRAPPTTLEELGARIDVAMSLLEVDHLERLYRELGRNESQAVLLRLLAPLSTVAWRVIRPG